MIIIQDKKTGLFSTTYETDYINKPTNVHFVIEFSLEQLRKFMVKLLSNEMKKLKPDVNILSWNTRIGKISIYKDWELDSDVYDPWKSKYKWLYLYVEQSFKDDVITKKYLLRKVMNGDYEDAVECETCFKTTVEPVIILRHGTKLHVCKKCKKFDELLNKLEKQLEEEKQEKKKNTNRKKDKKSKKIPV